MKLELFVSFVCFICAVNGKSIQLDQRAADWQLMWKCSQALNFQQVCPITDYPDLIRWAQRRQLGVVPQASQSKDICDAVLPYFNCAEKMFTNIPVECQSTLFNAQSPLGYAKAKELIQKLFELINGHCVEDVKFFLENRACFEDMNFLMKLKTCFITHEPCTQFGPLTTCVREAMSPGCSGNPADFVIGKLRDVRAIIGPACETMETAGRDKMHNYIKNFAK